MSKEPENFLSDVWDEFGIKSNNEDNKRAETHRKWLRRERHMGAKKKAGPSGQTPKNDAEVVRNVNKKALSREKIENSVFLIRLDEIHNNLKKVFSSRKRKSFTKGGWQFEAKTSTFVFNDSNTEMLVQQKSFPRQPTQYHISWKINGNLYKAQIQFMESNMMVRLMVKYDDQKLHTTESSELAQLENNNDIIKMLDLIELLVS